MAVYLSFTEIEWLCVSTVEVLFFVYVLIRRLYRSHPFFSFYILALLLQTVGVALVYLHWGATSHEYWIAAWLSQAVVVATRWLAILEIARKVFVPYSGIWQPVGLILMTLSVAVLVYAVAISGVRFDLMVIAADRRVELFIAVFVVAMFTFARYYRLTIADADRQLAIGFCLYSCVWVINDSLYEGWRQSLGSAWDVFQTIAFLATVLIWLRAVHSPGRALVTTPAIAVSPEVYAQLSDEVNSRLFTLNKRLNHLFRSEDSRS